MNEQSSGFFASKPGRRGEEIDTPAPLFRASFDLTPPHGGHSSTLPPQLVKCKCLVVADSEPRVHQSTSLGPLPVFARSRMPSGGCNLDDAAPSRRIATEAALRATLLLWRAVIEIAVRHQTYNTDKDQHGARSTIGGAQQGR